jgi:hypothetical protein
VIRVCWPPFAAISAIAALVFQIIHKMIVAAISAIAINAIQIMNKNDSYCDHRPRVFESL